jgi:hypothetical protein
LHASVTCINIIIFLFHDMIISIFIFCDTCTVDDLLIISFLCDLLFVLLLRFWIYWCCCLPVDQTVLSHSIWFLLWTCDVQFTLPLLRSLSLVCTLNTVCWTFYWSHAYDNNWIHVWTLNVHHNKIKHPNLANRCSVVDW